MIYYPPGRDWNGNVVHHSNNNSCFGSIFIKVCALSLFLGGHTHNKTLSGRTIEGREDSGHYLAKECNASCIYILYISLNVILRTETPMNRSVSF